jgi:hypothetical protein
VAEKNAAIGCLLTPGLVLGALVAYSEVFAVFTPRGGLLEKWMIEALTRLKVIGHG